VVGSFGAPDVKGTGAEGGGVSALIVMVGGFGAPDGLGAGAKGGRTGALKLFTFSCLLFCLCGGRRFWCTRLFQTFSYQDVLVGGFGAPDGLGVGAKGGRIGALQLFTFSCLSLAYVVVEGFVALKVLFF